MSEIQVKVAQTQLFFFFLSLSFIYFFYAPICENRLQKPLKVAKARFIGFFARVQK